MAFNISAATAVLKEDYQGPIRDQLNLSTALLAQIERKTVEVVGKRAFIPVHVTRSDAVGARGDGGTLPTANNQGYTDVLVPVKYNYGSIRITGPTIKAAKSDAGAFLRAVDSETKGMAKELKEDFNRQMCRNDVLGTGVLATLTGNSSNTTLPLTGADVGTNLILRQGMTVDLVTQPSTINTTAEVISSVTLTAGIPTAVVVGVAAAPSASDVIIRTGSVAKELIGLEGMILDSGVLHSVDPSVYPVWKSTNVNNGGVSQPLSEALMQSVMSSVAIASGDDPNAIGCQHTQRDKFYSLLSSLKRAPNTLELKGGFKALTYNDDIPLLVDRMISPTKMFFLNLDHLAIYEMCDWEWADDDGAVLSRATDNTDSWTAFMRKFAEFGTDMRNAHGVLKDLA